MPTEILVFGGTVLASLMLLLYALWPKGREDQDHVLRRMAGRRAGEDKAIAGQPRSNSAAKQMLEKVAPYAIKPIMPKSEEEITSLRKKLSQAGFRHESASRYFLASKTIIAIALGGGALMLGVGAGYQPKLLIGLLSFLGGIGFFLPDIWLWIARTQRADKIRGGLPDSLDLLVVSVEAGLGLDAGIQRVGEEMRHVHTILSEEMQLAVLETQMGVPRSEALTSMANRSGVEEMRALVAVITQAEKFGTSVAKALRIQADTLRVRRRLKAEERAQKTTVKLMLPLILFIFPSIFVVLLGPAVLHLMKALGSGGSLGG